MKISRLKKGKIALFLLLMKTDKDELTEGDNRLLKVLANDQDVLDMLDYLSIEN